MLFKSPFKNRKSLEAPKKDQEQSEKTSEEPLPIYTASRLSSSSSRHSSLPTGTYLLTSAVVGVEQSSPDAIIPLPSPYESRGRGASKLSLATYRPENESHPSERALMLDRGSDFGQLEWQFWYIEKAFTGPGDNSGVRERLLKGLKPGEDVYTITNLTWNKILAAAADDQKKGKGGKVMLVDADTMPLRTAFFWKIEKLAGVQQGYRIINLDSGYCLLPEKSRSKGWSGALVTDAPNPKKVLTIQAAWRFWKPSLAPPGVSTGGWVKLRNVATGMVLRHDAPMGLPYLSRDGGGVLDGIAAQWTVLDRRALDRGIYDSSRADEDYRRGGFLIRNRLTGAYLAHHQQRWGSYNDGDEAVEVEVETTVTVGGKGYWDAGRRQMNIWDMRNGNCAGSFRIAVPGTSELLAAGVSQVNRATSDTRNLPAVCEKLPVQTPPELSAAALGAASWLLE